jgi:hypothetical protein
LGIFGNVVIPNEFDDRFPGFSDVGVRCSPRGIGSVLLGTGLGSSSLEILFSRFGTSIILPFIPHVIPGGRIGLSLLFLEGEGRLKALSEDVLARKDPFLRGIASL